MNSGSDDGERSKESGCDVPLFRGDENQTENYEAMKANTQQATYSQCRAQRPGRLGNARGHQNHQTDRGEQPRAGHRAGAGTPGATTLSTAAFLFLFPFALYGATGVDPFSGSASTAMATYDTYYANARASYNVSNLQLDGLGNVRTTGAYDGGFSYTRPGSQRDHGQTSGMKLVGRGGNAVNSPYLRFLVQTDPTGNSYYGWQFVRIENGNYAELTWYRGADFMMGKTFVDIRRHEISSVQPIVVRTTIEMPSTNVQIVRAWAGPNENSLVNIDSITVTEGGGIPSDPAVPWLTGRWPGMLFYNNGGATTRSLFSAFTDGISFDVNARFDALTVGVGNRVTLQVTGHPGRVYRAQVSTNLERWEDFTTIVPDETCQAVFEELEASSEESRYFRLVWP